jgi:hypothetical protein
VGGLRDGLAEPGVARRPQCTEAGSRRRATFPAVHSPYGVIGERRVRIRTCALGAGGHGHRGPGRGSILLMFLEPSPWPPKVAQSEAALSGRCSTRGRG